jgi:hypothetical protein
MSNNSLASDFNLRTDWFVKFDQPNLEIIWVSYKKSNGCILGDHSF